MLKQSDCRPTSIVQRNQEMSSIVEFQVFLEWWSASPILIASHLPQEIQIYLLSTVYVLGVCWRWRTSEEKFFGRKLAEEKKHCLIYSLRNTCLLKQHTNKYFSFLSKDPLYSPHLFFFSLLFRMFYRLNFLTSYSCSFHICLCHLIWSKQF